MASRVGSAVEHVSETPRFEVFASGLDHPECIAFDRDGNLWAGGEAGQIYRIDSSGAVTTVTTLGGFIAGIAFSPLDQMIYVCNSNRGIFGVEADGRRVSLRADCEGTARAKRGPCRLNRPIAGWAGAR